MSSPVFIDRPIEIPFYQPRPLQHDYENPPHQPHWGHVGGAQIGTLSCAGRILPLYSTEHHTRRGRYNYHTLTDSVTPDGRYC